MIEMIPQGRFSLSVEGLLLADSKHWKQLILPHNKSLQPTANAAAKLTRYVHFHILTMVSIVILSLYEWRSQDLEGNEIQSQRDSIL